MINEIILGDCLELMPQIESKSIDMILCDLPYGVTNREEWDILIPFDKLWLNYERIIKDNGAICLTATEPFRTKLISSNFKLFKYDLIWVKNKTTGFLNAKKQPLRKHESILVFYKNQPKYNPQKTTGHKPVNSFTHHEGAATLIYGQTKAGIKGGGQTDRYPTSILEFPVVNNTKEKIHPSQKPIELFEYLIKTYTDENDLVLDNCVGSGTTCLAAKNLNRNYIGMEKEEKFFNLAKERLEK
jgi:site-specific DNA-methyltransferase (adenine-specific)